MTPDASIVIPLYNNRRLTELCLDSIAAALGDRLGRSWELVLVDNGSLDDTAVLLDAWRERTTQVRFDENRAFARAVNAGVEAASGEIVVILNNDMEIPPGALEALAEEARDPSIGLVGARLVYPSGYVQHGGCAFRTWPNGKVGVFHLFHHEPAEVPAARASYDVEGVTGACMALRRDVFREVGGFDEAFVMDLDDIDLSLRIRAQGLRVRYRGDVCIVHHEGATRSTSNRANHDHFHGRWEEFLVPDDELLLELFSARIDPRANDESLTSGRRAEVSVEGMVTGIAPEADEARALLAGLDALGVEAAARDHSLPLQIAALDAETDALLHAARARPRRDGALVLEVSRPEAFHHTGTPTVLRLAAVPERRRRLASPFALWAPDETAARAFAAAGFPHDRISVLAPYLPRVTAGPGGRGVLAVLPSHLPQLAEATARALAPLAGERELRLALTVATPELREAAAAWAPGAEVLPRPLREHDLAREAREADAVVVLDPDDGFQRGILAAAGAGAAVVARPGGAAQGVLGAALATCADAASVGAVRAAVDAALAGTADRASRSATVAAACSGPAFEKRLAGLLDAARPRAAVRRPRPPRAPAQELPAVLVVSREPPDPRARTLELRTAGLLRSLARLGHAPTLLCSDAKLRDDVAEELWEDGVEVCFGDRAGLDRRGLLKRRFGAVVFPDLEMARMARGARLQFPGIRIVIDAASAQFPRLDEHAAFVGTEEARAAAAAGRTSELEVLRQADLVFVPGVARQDLLVGLLPGVPVGVLPSAQDVVPAGPAESRRGVVLLADWSRPESGYAVQALCQDVLPVLRGRGFAEQVALVGPGLTRDLVRVARGSDVEPLGYAPDLARQLASFRACLAPGPFDGGTGSRLGASLAHGLPVIATPPVAALLDEHRGVLVGATPDELAGHVLALAADPALFARLSADGQAHAAERLSPARVDAELHEALSYLLQPRAVEVA